VNQYFVSNCGKLEPRNLETGFELDPRGIVWIFEPPKPGASYFMGVDPARGIVNWDRKLRLQDDDRTDNGCIEVVKKGNWERGIPDVQVCEFAAPIDAEELADVANAIGRVYGGNNEDGQAMAIIEVWPGPGEPTQRWMISHFGYTNLYVPVRYANTLTPERGRNVVGWVSSQRSRRDLWTRGMKHIIQERLLINSPALAEEMADCQADDWMASDTARARWGKHDDRVVAMLLAIYAAHDWSWEIETIKSEVTSGGSIDWQKSDCTVEEMYDAWNERFSQLLES